MDEYITRNNVISAVCFGCNQEFSDEPCEPDACAIRKSIMALPTADVVPKSEVDLLKSLITHKEEEAYNKGYADAKADILEKLQAEVERAETIAKYGDDFYEGKAEGVNAAMNCILSEGEE